jgi:hypothetical protein
MSSETAGAYDAQADAKVLAAPLKKWAWVGFLRGFSGFRKSMLPVGRFILPSTAFSEVAYASIDRERDGEEEYERRLAYIMAVEEILAGKQSEFVLNHYKNTIRGHVADFLLALLFVVLGGLLIYRVGPFSPLTWTMLSLIGIKIIFLQVSVRRAIGIAQDAFQAKKEDIVLPWTKST